jgi:predicted transcriptional regulator
LDDSLVICKKYNRIEGIAYLLQKTGAIQEALDMLSQLFFNKLRECLKNFVKSKQIKPED